MNALFILIACALCIVGGYALGYERATTKNIEMQTKTLIALLDISKILENIEKETKK